MKHHTEASECLLRSPSLSVSKVWEQRGLCTISNSWGQSPAAWLPREEKLQKEKGKFEPKFPPAALFSSRLRISMCSYKVERWWQDREANSEPLLSPRHSEPSINVCWMNGLSENLSGSDSYEFLFLPSTCPERIEEAVMPLSE